MKIKKMLPLALALMVLCPATFAVEGAQDAAQLLEISVPEFINITSESTAVTSTAEFDATYQTITLKPAMTAQFKVVNNKKERDVYLKGTAKTSGADEVALYGTAENAMKLVFTNINAAPAASSVKNITGGSAAAGSNPNAIAFAITSAENFGADSNSGAGNPTISFEDGVAKYIISNGVFTPSYTLATSAESQTFSTHDQNGTYQATLTLTTASN